MLDIPEKLNVSKVVSQKLCNTCGACFSVCKAGAIEYQETVGGLFVPVVDENTCIKCGICLSVCGGIYFSTGLKKRVPEDPFAGRSLNAFVGKARSERIYRNSQSGGIVSALLIHALRAGEIKGAATIKMEPGSPCRPVVKVARTSQEIYDAQKSKYCPVPLLSFLREIKEEEGPFALVGLSCHIHGLHNILDLMPKLKPKLAFTIGLVCDRVLTYAALDYLVEKSSVTRDANTLLHFRDKSVAGYPGDVHVVGKNDSRVMSASERIRIKKFFTPPRCHICFDKMNVFSDITVGDPHGIPDVDRKTGESIVVSRTAAGESVIKAAAAASVISIRSVDYNQILTGQNIEQKKSFWYGYIEAWKRAGKEVPQYCEVIRPGKVVPLRIIKKCIRDLKYALDIDEFQNRNMLIAFVRKKIKVKQLTRVVLYPLKLPFRIARIVMMRLSPSN